LSFGSAGISTGKAIAMAMIFWILMERSNGKIET